MRHARVKIFIPIICMLILLLWLHFHLIPTVTSSYNKDCYMNERFKESLTFMLRTIITAFETHNVEYWLDYGTLLGAIRHKGLIPWDGDGDISYMKDDLNIKGAFVDIRKQDIEINSMIASYKGVSVDMVRWTPGTTNRGENYLYKYLPPWSADHVLQKIYHRMDAFPFEWIGQRKRMKFLGVQAAVPERLEALLKHRYSLSYTFNINVQYRWKCYVPCWLSTADSSCH